ncbi:Repeat domain-containing protein [Actinopolymorpha cephalotaxi]|uniref:Repeat domain-containing protein n=1 Tax=Actinopolymorpha cephalotaxi TaxID=504797 RepID=A0A1I2LSM4_9ACTN|nr:VCBS repeat-containing protein [Actinopolymorpha cephalotaxi]NYH81436.1 hypothetical protein [Actinopolymorpha cephalotaxi]SFF82334.1 Repeat domain-containing protein [Actinopolymorpha cephalotaxi]
MRIRQQSRSVALALVLLTAWLVWAPTPRAYAQTVTFGPVTNYSTEGRQPRSVAAGDFNRDGNMDLVTANNQDNNVSVFLGIGAGLFGEATRFAAQNNPRSVAVGDFNKDGRLDLAVANFLSNSVSILLGTGTGTFGAATNFTVGTGPQAVAVGDFNRDSNPDLATANFTGNNITIRLGTGTGGFGAASTFGLNGATSPYGLAVGDFNNDTNPDLAVADSGSNNVSILLGTGTGTFGAATNFALGGGTSPRGVAVGDFNTDGRADLAVTNQASGNLSVLLGTGTGGFGAATNYTVGNQPFSVAVADLDFDGHEDLVTADGGGSATGNRISVLLGTGTATFGAASGFSMGTGPQSVVAADFNNDGLPDVATANSGSDNLSVRLNTTIAGTLSITVPGGPVSAGNGAPGAQLSTQLGPASVADRRAPGPNLWTVTVTSTDFATSPPTQTISKAAASYWSGPATSTTGSGNFVPGQPTAAGAVNLNTSRTAFSKTTGTGLNTATWNPTLIINIPAQATAGTYTGTITHSVA